MDILESLRNRRSSRAFRDEFVPRDLLKAVLSDAANAPSAINMQPWEVHMVLGEELKRLSRHLLRFYRERNLTCGPGSAQPLPNRFMERARDCAVQMTPLIEQMGTDFKTFVNEGSLNFYGAPVVAFLFIDEAFPPERTADIGAFLAYLVLAAAGHGLASCPIGLVRSYQDELKEHLNIAESKNLVVSVALGWPDKHSPINQFRSSRANSNEFVRWID